MDIERVERTSAAPGALEQVRTFVNTLDVEEGTDLLDTAESARAWLGARGVELARDPRPQELRRLVALREAIRDAAAGRATALGARGLEELDRIAAAHPLQVRLGGAGSRFAVRGTGIDGFIERTLAIVATATIDGSWERLKVCPNDECRWVFYDHSRNRSRTWCSMDVCGARAKMRTYRSRRRVTSR